MIPASWKRTVWVGAIIVLLMLVASGTSFVYSTVQRLHAYSTQAYMKGIAWLVEDYEPHINDPKSLCSFLRQHDRSGYCRDGWGHPFLIETWRDRTNSLYHYRITALGRAGKRSSCCQAEIGHNWDLNNAIEDGHWIQSWNF